MSMEVVVEDLSAPDLPDRSQELVVEQQVQHVSFVSSTQIDVRYLLGHCLTP